MGRILITSLILICAGCARLDHVQISDIDQTVGETKPISVRVSNTGFDAATTTAIASELATSDNVQENLGDLAALLALINMGPTTGNPTYNDRYAEKVLIKLHQKCPSGKITGIRSIREATSYGTVSGEIVRINADCIL